MVTRCNVIGLVICASVCFFAGWGLFAEEPAMENLLPEGTVAYFTVTDAGRFKEQFEGTALYKIYMEQQVQDFISKGIKPLPPLEKQAEGVSGIKFSDWAGLVKGRFALAVVRLGMIVGPNPLSAVFIVDVTENRQQWDDFIQSTLEGRKDIQKYAYDDIDAYVVNLNGRAALSFAFVGNYFVAGGRGKGPVEAVIDKYNKRDAPALSSNASFNETKSELLSSISEPAYFGYLDTSGVLDYLGDMVPEKGELLIKNLGLKEVRSVGVVGRIEDGGFNDLMFFNIPGQKPGIFSVYSSKVADEALLSLVPAGSASFQIANVHLDRLYKEVLAAIDSVLEPPLGTSSFISPFEEEAGFRLGDDLLGSLGTGIVTYYFLPEAGTVLTGISKQAFLLEVADREKIETCAAKLRSFAEAKAAEKTEEESAATPPAPGLKAPSLKDITFSEKEYEGSVITIVSFGPDVRFRFSYAFTDKYMILAPSDDFVRSALDAVKNPGPSILENKDFTDGLQHLPGRRTSIAFSDMQGFFGFVYKTIVPLLMLSSSASGQSGIDFTMLPPAEVISQHLFAMVSTTDVNDKGIYWRSYGPVSTSLSMAAAGGGMLVAVPYIGKARGLIPPPAIGGITPPPAAKIEKPMPEVKKNLSQVAIALHLYGISHDREFPDTLEDLVPDYLPDAVYLQPAGPTEKEGVAYEYVGGLRFDMASEKIIVYEKQDIRPDGRYVLYVNGKIEFLPEDEFQKKMKEQQGK